LEKAEEEKQAFKEIEHPGYLGAPGYVLWLRRKNFVF